MTLVWVEIHTKDKEMRKHMQLYLLRSLAIKQGRKQGNNNQKSIWGTTRVLGIYCFLGWEILRTCFYTDEHDPVK